MRGAGGGRGRRSRTTDPDLDSALEAMTAPELRTFVRTVLDTLGDTQRVAVVDSLVTRAAQGKEGWRPSRPTRRAVEDAQAFAQAARRVGYADPDEISEHLRRGTKAFLSGDHASARALFEALLPAIATGDVDLGQHELASEVLTVDAHACVAQYVTSVYTTTSLNSRAEAVFAAIERVEGVSSLWSPVEDMEGVSAGALPDLAAFLPLWVTRLRSRLPSKDEWESAQERWLREAVRRLDGVDGLERLARRTKRPQTCLAWCEAFVESGDWAKALSAYDTAAKLVATTHWRGTLLDGAALAAQHLGRSDVPERLEAAWRTAPTLTRLLRWLVANGSAVSASPAKIRGAMKWCPRTAGRQLGLLRVFAGDVQGAAAMLLEAPGLGWSSADHPGHVLFPLFAILLADGTPGRVSPMLVSDLESTGHDPLEAFDDGIAKRPRLATPSIVALMHDTRASIALNSADRGAMLDAMRVAAERRVESILGHSRRRHYRHAATLVASCLSCAPWDLEQAISDWILGLRQTYSRRHAFRDELTRALESLGVSGAG